MCQSRVEDKYIYYLQGLANEAVMAEQRQATIDKALALPLDDQVKLWLQLCERLAPGVAQQWRRERLAEADEQIAALNLKFGTDEAAIVWEIDNLAIIEPQA